MGEGALKSTTTGSQNTAVGVECLKLNQTGGLNTGVGRESLKNTTANSNVGVGWYAGKVNTSGTENVFVGYNAASTNTTGSYNTFIGKEAGHNNITTGSNNTLLGYKAAASSATVSNEVTIGDTNITKFRVPGINFTVKDSTATEDYVLTVDANGECGWEAAAGGGLSSDSDKNTIGGTNAGNSITAGSGLNNTLIGYDAGTSITTGDHSTALGKDALKSVTTAYGNMGIGRGAGQNITTGQQNTCVGLDAGNSLTTQGNNACFGEMAMWQTKGTKNAAIGYQSMALAYFGDYNTALGAESLKVVGGSSDGSGGDYNVAIGYKAGDALETGNNNIIIGYNAAATSDSTNNEITLGDTNITKFRVPGLNFTVKDSTATQGYVLTVDSNGEAGFAEAAGGGPSDDIFYENGQTVTSNYTITNGKNAMSAGPIAIASGVTVTIGANENWTVV